MPSRHHAITQEDIMQSHSRIWLENDEDRQRCRWRHDRRRRSRYDGPCRRLDGQDHVSGGVGGGGGPAARDRAAFGRARARLRHDGTLCGSRRKHADARARSCTPRWRTCSSACRRTRDADGRVDRCDARRRAPCSSRTDRLSDTRDWRARTGWQARRLLRDRHGTTRAATRTEGLMSGKLRHCKVAMLAVGDTPIDRFSARGA